MDEHEIERHYSQGQIVESILRALAETGKDLTRLTPEDLAPVDQFHVRGREATVELAGRAQFPSGTRVLDVGCGLGGSARYLARHHGCRVSGIDLTQEYVDAANELARRVGLADRVDFRRASALDLPFADASFQVVWTEHVQMNIADKARFYGEIARVLAPGGHLLCHEVFLGPAGCPHFPVPWAETPAISFLATPREARQLMEAAGLRVTDWADRTEASLAWFEKLRSRLQASGPPRFGMHLITGENTALKFANNVRNLREGRIVVVQAVAVRD